jgi:hypothetical protein
MDLKLIREIVDAPRQRPRAGRGRCAAHHAPRRRRGRARAARVGLPGTRGRPPVT